MENVTSKKDNKLYENNPCFLFCPESRSSLNKTNNDVSFPTQINDAECKIEAKEKGFMYWMDLRAEANKSIL